jgi:phthiocerol/phenolphthiocerol synthesis type-I polyketide synthase C
LDPQQRLALEVAYATVRDAWLTPLELSQVYAGHRTGVFVGAGSLEHMSMQTEHVEHMTKHTMAGNTLGNIANRISFAFDWTGPSLAVDTACSSSMTALHLAVRSLQAGDCDSALVMGINLLVGPGPFVGFSQAHMLSPTGTSRPFDKDANGFVRAEGCVAFLLQRLDLAASPSRAKRCRALIRGVGINEDGRTPSLTFPSADAQVSSHAFFAPYEQLTIVLFVAQAALMQQVLRRNGLDPAQVVFVEAHGTGTQVGDKEEAAGIGRTFGGVLGPDRWMRVGSIKGNLGHLETGAAAASMAKVVLMLERRQFFPTAGYSVPNPAIDFAALRLRVEQSNDPFPGDVSDPLIAISSFGFGGANGVVVLSLPPPTDRAPRLVLSHDAAADRERWLEPEQWTVLSTVAPRCFQALLLSAHYPEGVDAALAGWAQHLGSREALLPELVALQAAVGDHTLRFRCAIVGDTARGLEHFLKTGKRVVVDQQPRAGEMPRLGFVFGGQGSHHVRMGVSLYRRFRVFRDTIHDFDRLYKRFSGTSLIEDYGLCKGVMAEATLASVDAQMPCIIAVQVGLVALLKVSERGDDLFVQKRVGLMGGNPWQGCRGAAHGWMPWPLLGGDGGGVVHWRGRPGGAGSCDTRACLGSAEGHGRRRHGVSGYGRTLSAVIGPPL